MSRMHRIDWRSLGIRRPARALNLARPSRALHRRRLHIEALEDRRLLAVFKVTNLADDVVTMAGDAPGTLRQAIFDANNSAGPDVINFVPGLSGTITLTEGELLITGSGTIGGPGAGLLTIDASGNDPTPEDDNGDGSRIFNIDDATASVQSVKITGLTLTGGDADAIGGAIRSVEELLVRDSVISGNSAYATTGLLSAGGGIYSSGNLTIENSTISNNYLYHDSSPFGGGIAAGVGSFTLTNSTVSGNRANAPFGAGGGTGYGGGIFLGGGTHLIAHSTIARNDANGMASFGSGLFVLGSFSITLDHTIVGDNFAATNRDISSNVAVTARFSLVELATGWTLDDGGGNIIGMDPGLTFNLSYQGGPTPVHVLLPGSPAIDAGDATIIPGPTVPSFDQRGAPFERISDGDGNASVIIDIGAYERQTVAGLSLVVDTTADEIDGDYGAGDLSLREAVGLANGSIGPDTITFSPELSGKTILLTMGELRLTDSVTIDAATDAGMVTIDASGNDPTPSQNLGDGTRIFDIDDDDNNSVLDVELSGLTLTGGDEIDPGGAIRSTENLVLSRMTIRDNHSAGGDGGGGLHQRDGTLLIENSTISGNLVTPRPSGAGTGSGGLGAYGAGGIFLYLAETEIINSTISGNRVVRDFREGGGIVAGLSPLTIRHSTITGNSVLGTDSQGGNIYFRGGIGDELILDHTIVANGIAGTSNDISSPNDPIVANFSLIEDVTGLTINGSGNTTGLDPKLGPLTENGGLTKTHTLLAGSPAIDSGQFSFTPPPDFDQRGGPFVRLANGDGDAFTIIDIGAYERQTVAGLSLVVDTTADENDGNYGAGDLSLREAIGLANGSIGSDTITFAPELVGKTIVLQLGELRIVDDVEIDAAGLGGTLTIDAAGNDPTASFAPGGDGSRVFHVNDGDNTNFIDVELSGLTLTGGDIFGQGGAIYNSENLTINASTIRDNAVAIPMIILPGGGSGGGIGSSGGGVHVGLGGSLTLNGSTVHRNSALTGGGISIDQGQLTINSSTISGNTARESGGGIRAYGGSTTVTANHSTIARNSVSDGLVVGGGGGVHATNSGSISLNHTIVADNSAGLFPNVPSDVSSVDPVPFFHSLVEEASGFTPSGGPQFIGVDPLLAPLADNGGPTETHALKAGSPAIDAGNIAFLPPPDFDQRGGPFVRRFDGNGDMIPRIDLGAYERQTLPGLSLVVDTTNDLVDGDFGPGQFSLREAVKLANGSVGSDTITFAPALNDQTIPLVQGEMMIVDDVSIDATNLTRNVIVDASSSDPTPDRDRGDGSRIFLIDDNDVDSSFHVALSGLTLTGGDVSGNGGAILSVKDLTLFRSTIAGNAASDPAGVLALGGNGGGIVQLRGTLVIDSSTISGNLALGQGSGGGIAVADIDSFTLSNSTVSGNLAGGSGGGMYVHPATPTALLHSTISGNEAAQSGGGIYNRDSAGLLSLNHTIVANNQAATGPDIFGGSVPLVYSLVEAVGGFTPIDGPRITGQDPLLGPLADNGGPTETHALLAGSPAIDAGNLAFSPPPNFDQRGAPFAREVDGLNLGFAVIDMGAFEFDPNSGGLPGDYNSNGVVDAADYTVWRDHLGSSFTLDNENPAAATPGVVDQEDYDFWKANFGQTLPASAAGGGAISVASEPANQPPALLRGGAAIAVSAMAEPVAAAVIDEQPVSSAAVVDRALVELFPVSLPASTTAYDSTLRRATPITATVADRLLLLLARSQEDRSYLDGHAEPATSWDDDRDAFDGEPDFAAATPGDELESLEP